MKKIPSIFVRDWKNNPRLVTTKRNEECLWVFEGKGIPTEKLDGTACMIKDNVLYKRYDAKYDKKKKKWKPKPDGFIPCQEPDEITGHQPGWVKVNLEDPSNKWHRQAFESSLGKYLGWSDGTYELIGLKINGNPYNLEKHILSIHGAYKLNCQARTYHTIKEYLQEHKIEGIVWHYNKKMAKIKRTDFDLEWPIKDFQWRITQYVDENY